MPKIVALITMHANTGVRTYVGHNSWHKRYDLLIQITEKVQEGPLKKVGWPHFGNGFKMSFVKIKKQACGDKNHHMM